MGKESAVNFVVNNQVVLSRVPEGPIAAYIGSFLDSLNAMGYTAYSVHRFVLLAVCFSKWLKQRRVRLRSITSDHAEQYLQCRYLRLQRARSDAAALGHLIDFLRREGAIPVKKIAVRRMTRVELCTQAYEKYLREARALARATIVNYVPFIRDFLNDCFGDGPVTFAH